MKNTLFGAVMFVAGAGAGAFVTWKYTKTKYERLAQEEIDSVKEAFSKSKYYGTKDSGDGELDEPETSDNDDREDNLNAMNKYEYEAMIRRMMYSTVSNKEKGVDEPAILAPYVINPDRYGEDGYSTSMMTWYSDEVLEDDYWNVINNVDDIIGTDFVNHFGEYEDDVVYVRNEELKTDYEITKDKRTYAESQQGNPYVVTENDC